MVVEEFFDHRTLVCKRQEYRAADEEEGAAPTYKDIERIIMEEMSD